MTTANAWSCTADSITSYQPDRARKKAELYFISTLNQARRYGYAPACFLKFQVTPHTRASTAEVASPAMTRPNLTSSTSNTAILYHPRSMVRCLASRRFDRLVSRRLETARLRLPDGVCWFHRAARRISARRTPWSKILRLDDRRHRRCGYMLLSWYFLQLYLRLQTTLMQSSVVAINISRHYSDEPLY
jgi:hypothetical protein